MKYLIVIKETTDVKIKVSSKHQYLFLPLGCTELELHKLRARYNFSNVILINPKLFHHQSEKQVRNFIHKYFSDFATKLTSSDFDAWDTSTPLNTWWLTGFSEKSPSRSNLPSNLYDYSQIHFTKIKYSPDKIIFLKKKNIYLSSKLLRTMKFSILAGIFYYLQFFRLTIKLLLCKFYLKSYVSDQLLPNAVFTLFPFWWKIEKRNQYKDRFFDETFLNFQESNSLEYLFWSTLKFSFLRKNSNFLETFFKNNSFVSLQNYFTFDIFIKYLSPKIIMNLIKMQYQISESEIIYLSFDIRNLLTEELLSSSIRSELVQNLLISECLKNYINKTKCKSVLYRFENQPIDRAIAIGASENALTIGFWHSQLALSNNYLSLNFKNELMLSNKYHTNFKSLLPMQFITPTSSLKELLVQYGVEASKIRVLGNIRFRNLQNFKFSNEKRLIVRKKLGLPTNVKFYIVSFSISDELDNFLEDLANAILDSDRVAHIYFARHPSKIKTKKIQNGNPNQIILNHQNFSIYEMLASADFLISGGSQIVFESTMLNIPSVVYEPYGIFNATNFSKYHSLSTIKTTIPQICTFLDITSKNESQLSYIKKQKVERDILGIQLSSKLNTPTTHSNYLKSLRID